jgi:hypothetical protein
VPVERHESEGRVQQALLGESDHDASGVQVAVVALLLDSYLDPEDGGNRAAPQSGNAPARTAMHDADEQRRQQDRHHGEHGSQVLDELSADTHRRGSAAVDRNMAILFTERVGSINRPSG